MSTNLFISGLLFLVPMMVVMVLTTGSQKEFYVQPPPPTREQIWFSAAVWIMTVVGLLLISFAITSKIKGN